MRECTRHFYNSEESNFILEAHKCDELKSVVQVTADPWCSCGGLAPDGTLVSVGGFLDGIRTIRYYGGPACKGNNCDWREYNGAMNEDRWLVHIQL
jgi:hypothetical protein